jgi:SAM-dependent methyltransferase
MGAPDCLPIPPAEMIALTTGFYDARQFYELGRKSAGVIRDEAERHGLELSTCDSVFDFGCGCGRVMRQWQHLETPRLMGADYNPYFVEWCRKTLGFARFEVAHMPEGLTFEDESVTFTYSLSVFTHLDLEAQTFWMDELRRILKPGGILYVTLQGRDNIAYLSDAEKERFARGEMVIRAVEQSGASSCVVYHPEQYVRDRLARDFTVVAYRPGGAVDMGNQDIVVLQKPSR